MKSKSTSNVRAIAGGMTTLQRIMDEAFGMGTFAKGKPKRNGPVNRKAVWPMGRTILRVRWMTRAELKREGWQGKGGGIALDLNDGGILYAAADSEGAGPGSLFAVSPRGECLTVIPKK